MIYLILVNLIKGLNQLHQDLIESSLCTLPFCHMLYIRKEVFFCKKTPRFFLTTDMHGHCAFICVGKVTAVSE